MTATSPEPGMAPGANTSAAITSGVEVRLATRDDIEPVCRLLAASFRRARSVPLWRSMLESPYLSAAEKPHYGAVVMAGGRVVGYNGAIFADRLIDGRIERFGSGFGWYVDPDYRRYSIALLAQLRTATPDVTWTNLTSRGDMVPLFLKLGYQRLDTRKFVCYSDAAMLTGLRRRVRVVPDDEVTEALLGPEPYRIYADHLGRTVQRIVFEAGGASCLLVTKRIWFPARRSGKGVGGTELFYASDKGFLERHFNEIRLRHFMRDKVVAVLADERLLGFVPKRARVLDARGLFKSKSLPAEKVDALYSELTILP